MAIHQILYMHLCWQDVGWDCYELLECWLGSFVIVQGMRTSFAKKLHIFVIFKGGLVRTPCSPPLDPRMEDQTFVGFVYDVLVWPIFSSLHIQT